MADKNIEISLLKSSEIDELLVFYNFLYKDNRTKEKFLWEFHNAPAGKAIYVVAKDSDTQKIVGSQCAIPVELVTSSGTVILTAKSEDTLVDPDYRGLHIFENMYQLLFEKCRENGIKYLWGFTSAKKPFLRLGFEIPYDHSQSLMVMDIFSSYKYLSALNPKNNFTSLSKIFALCFLSKLASLKGIMISGKSLKNKFSYSEYGKALPQNISDLIQPDSKGFCIKQDMPFMMWRIVNNPYHEKIFNIYFFMGSDLAANLVFNHHKNGVWYLVSDTYSAKLSEEQQKSIYKKAVKLLLAKEKSNVKLIRTWDFSHNENGNKEIRIRKQAGFTHINRGVSFVWKSLDATDTLNVNDFNLSRIASQGVI